MKEANRLKQNIDFVLYLAAWGVLESLLVYSVLFILFS